MNDSEKLLTELKNIRLIMERSSRFLTLSGLSGVLIGLYALIGATLVIYMLIGYKNTIEIFRIENGMVASIIMIALLVLLLSLVTIFLLTIKKARKEQKAIWGPGSKLLLINLLIPLVAGGALATVLIFQQHYGLIASVLLLFYGMALVNAAKYTRQEILWLGIFEIVLGLLAAVLPQIGIYFWAFGFGILHIFYGLVFLREERKIKTA